MSILEKFPPVKGILQENVLLAKKSWFGVGGPADILFIPEDMDDLVIFLRNLPEGLPVTILGAMSNVIIRSGGIRGVVIILGPCFKKIYEEDGIIEVGAAVNCTELATFAMDAELGGLEFLMGLPGSIGGAIKMNAGCFGSDMSNILIEFEAISYKDSSIKWYKSGEVNFRYRDSGLSDDLIITRAWLRGTKGVTYSIGKKVGEIVKKRKESQPAGRTCGCTFKNPEGQKAWQLIEKAGCKGMRCGGAVVSEKHCNFIVNDQNASPEDIENLGERIAEKVLESSGVKLEWEVIRLGEKLNS